MISFSLEENVTTVFYKNNKKQHLRIFSSCLKRSGWTDSCCFHAVNQNDCKSVKAASHSPHAKLGFALGLLKMLQTDLC